MAIWYTNSTKPGAPVQGQLVCAEAAYGTHTIQWVSTIIRQTFAGYTVNMVTDLNTGMTLLDEGDAFPHAVYSAAPALRVRPATSAETASWQRSPALVAIPMLVPRPVDSRQASCEST